MFSARGYLWAALAATFILLLVLASRAIASGEQNVLPNALALGPIIAIYVFAVTLAAGSIGLVLVWAFGWTRLACYQGIGAVLGASCALLVWWGTGDPKYAGAAALVFATMGFVAASVYWKVIESSA